ncbi:MAG: Lrp/AsnC ligand binding domain-containing protein [Nitrososphaerota archaeon]
MRGLVLIRLKTKDLKKFLNSLKKVSGVKDSFIVFGRFDAIALIEGATPDKLKEIVLNIRNIEGVKKTETLIEV